MSANITEMLQAVSRQEAGANDKLFNAVYPELKSQAKRQLQIRRRGQSLHTTVLVNEACIRLCGEKEPKWENRKHFFFVAARAMHDVVVEYARKNDAKRRGGGERRVSMDVNSLVMQEDLDTVLDVSSALNALKQHDERSANIVLLRYFGGQTHAEIAKILNISIARARSEWSYAKAWLLSYLDAY